MAPAAAQDDSNRRHLRLCQSFPLQDCQDKPVHPHHYPQGAEELQCFHSLLKPPRPMGICKEKSAPAPGYHPNGALLCSLQDTHTAGTPSTDRSKPQAASLPQVQRPFSWQQQLSLKASRRDSEGCCFRGCLCPSHTEAELVPSHFCHISVDI